MHGPHRAVYGAGYGTGWVYRVGNTRGVLPSHPAPREEDPDSGAGPGQPCRGWEWVVWVWTRVPGGGWSCTHPAGPVAHPWAPWRRTALTAASWPIRARFHLISYKVSQNLRVSPKYVQKACVSPCFQNGSQKSPLDFPGFLFLLAFSHKELMGLF